MPIAFRAVDGSLTTALKLSETLGNLAIANNQITVGSVFITEPDPAVVLGRLQCAKHIVDLMECTASRVTVQRRNSSGPAVYVPEGGAAVWVVALPSLQALYADSTPENVINRNIRGFLQGFTKNCGLTSYFGRELISTTHQPTGIVAIDQGKLGGVQIEVWCGAKRSLALPRGICTEREQNTDRFTGKVPSGWNEIASHDKTLRKCQDSVSEFAVSANTQPLTWRYDLGSLLEDANNSTLPIELFSPSGQESLACPIGWIDRYMTDGKLTLAGDVIASPTTMSRIAAAISLPDEAECTQRIHNIFAEEIVIGVSPAQLLALRG